MHQFTKASMVCGICKQPGHNRRTCIRRKVEEAAEAADEELTEQAKEKITDEIYKQWATDEALETAIDTVVDFVVPGLGICIRLTRYAWKIFKK